MWASAKYWSLKEGDVVPVEIEASLQKHQGIKLVRVAMKLHGSWAENIYDDFAEANTQHQNKIKNLL